jgi:hypothetical protein
MSKEYALIDPQLWQEMSNKLQSFYLKCIMADLYSERIKSGKRLKKILMYGNVYFEESNY